MVDDWTDDALHRKEPEQIALQFAKAAAAADGRIIRFPTQFGDCYRVGDDARTHNTAAAWSLYLTAYPNGAHAEEARRQLAQLEKAAVAARAVEEKAAAEALVKREPADFDAAFEKGTSETWDKFLAEHAESTRLAEARSCRQEALDFELAMATNTPAMWRAFIKTWPGGRHRIDAEIRLPPR